MLVESVIVIFILFYYYWYGVSYAVGSAEYAKENNNRSKEAENCWASVKDEFVELIQAIKEVKFIDIFLEFFDVVHAIMKYLIVNFLPQSVYYHWLCWMVVFPFVFPASVKLGNRYNKYKCIRNHSRPNRNHICSFNKNNQ